MPILERGGGDAHLGTGWGGVGVIHVPARGCLDALFTAPSPSPESSRTTSLLRVTKIFLKVRVGILGSNLISYYRFQDTDRRAARGAIRPYKSKRRLHWLGH